VWEPAELLEQSVVVYSRGKNTDRRERRRQETVPVLPFSRDRTCLRPRGEPDLKTHPAPIPGDPRDRLHKEGPTEAVLRACRTPRGDGVWPRVERRNSEREDSTGPSIGDDSSDEVEPLVEARLDVAGDSARNQVQTDAVSKRLLPLVECEVGRRPTETNRDDLAGVRGRRLEEEEESGRGRRRDGCCDDGSPENEDGESG